MCHVYNEKREKKNKKKTQGIELSNQEKHKITKRERKLQISGNIGSEYRKEHSDKRKSKKSVPLKKKKTSQDQTLW